MLSKQELFAIIFKTQAYKPHKTRRSSIKKKNSKTTKTKQRTGCPAGWTPPKPKPKKTNEPFSLFSYDIFHYHDAF